MRILRATVAAAVLLSALTAAGAERLDVKLGLWEMTSSMRFSGMPPLPKEVLGKMTPQQRADMAADLKAAAEEDVEPEVSTECITQEDLDKPFQSANADECKQTVVRTTRNTQEIRLACSGEIKGTGVFRVTTPTPDTMTGELDLKAGEGPNAFTIEGTIEGRWLGPDCGDEDQQDEEDDYQHEEEDETAQR